MLLLNLTGMLSREIPFILVGKSLLRELGSSDSTLRMLMESLNTNLTILKMREKLIRIIMLRLSPSSLSEKPQNILDSTLPNLKRLQSILLLLQNLLTHLENSMINGFLVFLSVLTMELTILKCLSTSNPSFLSKIMKLNTMDQLKRPLYSKLMRKYSMEMENLLKIGKKLKSSVASQLSKKQVNML